MKALVTGGGGFLGSHVARQLVDAGYDVVSWSRGEHAHLAAFGVRHVRGDLATGAGLADAARGAEVVFHVAAKAGVWGPRREYVAANVDGTRRVIDACRAAGTRALVFTSSPSVCFDGRDHVRASNNLPYATRFLAHYPETKAAAERLVLAANGPDLATCALRPHLIVGPGDPHLVPRLVTRARAGRLAIVGDGENEVSLTDVENAAAAHLDAARTLRPDAPHAGRAYFLGQEEPVHLWSWIADLVSALGLPRLRRRVSLRSAYAVGAVLEAAWRLVPGRSEPPMTRFVAQQLATSHSYDLAPARRDFGYAERVPLAVSTERIVRALRSH